MSDLSLERLRRCFEGAVPAVIATADATGTPNVTYLSRVRLVDSERIALSNQFFSKTARNLADNPSASVLVIDPINYDEFRLTLAYERTEKRGPVFEQLRADIEALAAFGGAATVFKLRAADIYRVVAIDEVASAFNPQPRGGDTSAASGLQSANLVELTTRLTRCQDLDTLVAATVNGLADLFGYEHSTLMLIDETGTRLYTIASRGYPEQGVGSEVAVGEGIVGMAAARGRPIRLGNLRQMKKYANTVTAMSESTEERDIPLPVLPTVQSRVAVPAMAFGQIVGVLVVESDQPVAYEEADEATLTVIASIIANAVEAERAHGKANDARAPALVSSPQTAGSGSTHVRFYRNDGSTFIDGDYLIKGVAGRILWALLRQHADEGRTAFSNREVRLDPSLELPEFRDNFESRLILLKRRLDEQGAPIRIEKAGRGRFELIVSGGLRLEATG